MSLPPFIEAAPFATAHGGHREGEAVRLVTVAMMRPGAKQRSYAFLGEALACLEPGAAWHLTIVGGGPVREQVEAVFAGFPAGRVSWRGELGQAEVAAALASADIFVWPGFDEAYGMSYLEAGAAGLPAVAMRCGGIASVVRDRETGLLADEGDLAGFADALTMLIKDAPLRHRLGRAARRFVLEERSVTRAAAILAAGLRRASDRADVPAAASA